MKALVLTHPKTLEFSDKPIPTPKEGEALVRLKAAALNHRDQWIREGLYAGIQPGVTLGSDGAGVVAAVGGEEHQEWVGRNVVINPNRNWGPNPAAQAADYNILGMPSDGTFAEWVCVPLDRLYPKPKHLSWAEAAAVPLGGLTAYRALFRQGCLVRGQKVLINGIGGGVAQWAFLFALAAGAEVWVSSSAAEKIAAAKEGGAKGGFNYRSDTWTSDAKKETGGFDLIIDSAGGNALNHLLNVVKPGGTIVFYGATTGVPDNLNLRKIFWSQIRLQGSTMGTDAEFADMLAFLEKHQIRPIMEAPLPFDRILEALDRMKEGRQFGKLVVEMEGQ
ncbi:zinc-binding dehydrogenase [Cesiribacter andamanensis]|uniref:Alcohol dehydrogenase n=1 Tax=Cesiribacter andamanensis AMV16 TaxID=1279009 RepID=M7N5E7_9BACT|nr:zinc-binding dehydrogenase [Cesiribacter andamanensis]EMR02451.1 Alcohol dehydrogenase [Cesiribacter andamanensis AMV16]